MLLVAGGALLAYLLDLRDDAGRLMVQLTAEVMMMRSLGTTVVQPPLSGDDVLYWRCDVF